ncbi:MAG: hypothetical protein LBR53_09030 [Deltaproteobacteria bacterium]|jgi:hypothetical protein|nr:hypothetical protein [Deltaproteobacteria bacterium]
MEQSGSEKKWLNYLDTAWKQVIVMTPVAFMEFFFPETAKLMDRERPIRMIHR